MLDARWVADHLDETAAALGRRSAATAALLEPVGELAARRRAAIGALEGKQAERNRGSEAMAKADKKSPEFAAQRDALKAVSGAIKELEGDLAEGFEFDLVKPGDLADKAAFFFVHVWAEPLVEFEREQAGGGA